MIFGHIDHFSPEHARFPEALKTALSYLKNTDLLNLATGTYELQGKDIFALVQEPTTKEVKDTRAEVHRQYIDVQYLVRGEERIGVATDLGQYEVAEDRLAEHDLLFYHKVDHESWLHLAPGNFAIFFPNDAHRPTCAVSSPMKIKKVVIKIRASLC